MRGHRLGWTRLSKVAQSSGLFALDRDEDEEEWERRVMELAAARIAAARVRLERLGIIAPEGKLVSTELPPDMLPDSDTTLETG